jgi:hypothetical protein
MKFLPILIGVIGTALNLAAGDPESAIIPLVILLLGLVINLFIVEATVDKDFIYLKQWVKESKYSIDNLDKVGDFWKGMTIIDIKTNVSTTRTFLIINDFDPSFFKHDSKDISTFLLKLKAAYSASKNPSQ